MMYAIVRLTMKAIFIMLLRSHLMFLYHTNTAMVKRRKKMLMHRATGLKTDKKSLWTWS